ncbi:MAG: helix-turn-helix domain-containing protein [Pedobacter sp.]|nr:helix-turn-helix domain-containing protein [Pedobacter sp.]MDQ8053137.1 helix-turn-helix domain-containing protein [Pedobacter sp.]
MREVLDPTELAAKFINLTSRHIFLTGKAGTGKTTFLKKLMATTHKKAVIVAPTGIAAINAAGVTIHSLFQLPFGTFLPREIAVQSESYQHCHSPRSVIRHLNMNAAKRRILIDLELLIIDEVSMLRADLLDAIDLILRYVRKNNSSSFGGVQVLFIGDLHQLPPVVKNEEWNLLGTCYKSAFFFDALVLEKDPPIYIELEKIYRQADKQFIHLLNNLRNNTVGAADIALVKTHYRPDGQPELKDNYITLTTHNHKADSLNKNRLAELKAPSFDYPSAIENEFAESAFPAERTLTLKVGAQVMFIKNDPTGEQRFFNGKIAVVTKLSADHIEVQLDGSLKLIVEKYTWKNIRYVPNPATNEIEEELIGTFTQYPLKLAWAITVHKSQGLTFDRAIIDIGDAFAPGQIYVALSRLRSLDGLVLTSLISDRGIRQDQNVAFFSRTKNDQEDLGVQIEREKDIFLKNALLNSFDLTVLDRHVYEHVFSYGKQERKSSKQSHLPWANRLQEEVMALKTDSDRFLKQIERLFANGEQESLEALYERTLAAGNYFSPRFSAMSDQIFGQIEVAKTQKQTKEYLVELIELEAMVYEQLRRIKKANALLGAVLKGAELTKDEVQALHEVAKREEQLKKIYESTNKDDFSTKGDDFYGKVKATKKQKTAKAPKVDTKELTLEMFRAGQSIADIAKTRKITAGTIESHLAHFVAKQELEATALMPAARLETILSAINSLKSVKLAEIREHLGKAYSFGEIKIAIAAYLAGS